MTRHENADPLEAVVKVGVAAVLLTVMGIRGCVVRSGLSDELTPVQTDIQIAQQAEERASNNGGIVEIPEIERVPATNFTIDGKEYNFVKLDTEIESGDQSLSQGLNVVDIECHRRNDIERSYNFDGAYGTIKVGQNVNFAGSQDDVKINRPNGEDLRLTIDCPGGKHGDDITRVYIDIDR